MNGVIRKCLPLENFKNDLPLDEYTGFIIVTRAHEYDNICLEQLRGYLPTYMGVMGSQNASITLLKCCVSRDGLKIELDMVYAPIGLDLELKRLRKLHYLSLVNIWQWCVVKGGLIAER